MDDEKNFNRILPFSVLAAPEVVAASTVTPPASKDRSSDVPGVSRLFWGLTLTVFLMGLLQNLMTFLSFFPKLSLGLFKNGIPQAYDSHDSNISPSKSFYGLAPVCGFQQLVWTTYSLVSVFRKVPAGSAVKNPPVLSLSFFILYIVGTIFNIAWPFLVDRSFLFEAAILEGLGVISFFPAYCIAATRYFYYEKELSRAKRYADTFVYRYGVLNGVAMQWAYLVINLIVDISMLLSISLSTPPSVELASNISLGILSMVAMAYAVVDVTVMQPIFSKIISPYIALIWSMGSILRNNRRSSNTSSMIAMCLMASTMVSLVLKMAISAYNYFIRRRNDSQQYKSKLRAISVKEISRGQNAILSGSVLKNQKLMKRNSIAKDEQLNRISTKAVFKNSIAARSVSDPFLNGKPPLYSNYSNWK